MAKRVQVAFDTRDPHALAKWWAELLEYEVEDHHDIVSGLLEKKILSQADVQEVNGRLGFADVAAARDASGGPRLFFQRVPETKSIKNRLHLDVPIDKADLDAEIERVTGLGASLVEIKSHPGERWAVMQDPEGNEFCLH